MEVMVLPVEPSVCPWTFGKVFHHRYLFICESQHLDQINHQSNTITDSRLLSCDPLIDQFIHCRLTAKTEPIVCQSHESHVATCEPLLQDSCVSSADCTGDLCQWMTSHILWETEILSSAIKNNFTISSEYLSCTSLNHVT